MHALYDDESARRRAGGRGEDERERNRDGDGDDDEKETRRCERHERARRSKSFILR